MTTTTTSQPNIRAATRGDLADIEALLAASQLPTAGIHDEVCGFLVAEVGSKIVGVVGMERHGRYGLLRSTAVDPAWRLVGLWSGNWLRPGAERQCAWQVPSRCAGRQRTHCRMRMPP